MKIGVVGASGLVGRTIVRVLEEQLIPIEDLQLFATSRSAGTKISFHNHPILVSELTKQTLNHPFDYLFFSAGSQCSLEVAPPALRCSTVVIDNSPAFRQDPSTPLVIPEINSALLQGYKGIIANPNCAAIQLLKAVSQIYKAFGIENLVVTTFQSRSGAGQRGLTDSSTFPRPIEENVIPLIGAILPDNSTGEELKIAQECRKILNDPTLPVFPTTVRVPVRVGHSESVFVQTRKTFELDEILSFYRNQPSLALAEDTFTPIDTEGSDITYISRIRKVGPKQLMMWVTADNIRVGAATNAVNIMKAHWEMNQQ